MYHLAFGTPALWLQQAPASPLGAFGSFLPMLAIVAIFYFLVFMPMQKQKKQQAAMLASLAAGHTVLTSGGIVGTIVSVQDDMLILRVKPDNVKLQVARNAVASVISPEGKEESK
jgi:preprotein translocase subunit YajC